MIGVYGVGGVPEPSATRATAPRPRPAETSATRATDGVAISTEAATRSRFVSEATPAETIRADRIERAKQSIEDGAYRVQDIVSQVAARIAPYIDI